MIQFRLFSAMLDFADTAMRVYMRLRSRVSPESIGKTFFGANMYCDTRDFIQRRVFYFNIFEPNLTYYILDRVKSGDHVTDVGANVGYVTLLLSSIVGAAGKVVAIEASPSTYQQLVKNIELNKITNVAALNLAATSGPCTVEIVVGEKHNSGSNSIRPSSGASAVSVKGDSLSNIAEIDYPRVTFIKIDVEGSEGPIIQNILDTLHLYTNLTAMVAELTEGSRALFYRLQEEGFRAYAFPNNYRIGYLFVRNYLSRSHEQGFVVKIPVDSYDPNFRDYVFERSPPGGRVIPAGASAAAF